MNIVFIRKNLVPKPANIKKRAFESFLARIIVKYAVKHFYNISNAVIIEEKKPRFDKGGIYFSISHSNDIVAAALDNFDIGFDIEYMKERNFTEIAKHLKWNNINTKQDFYREWTKFEALVKQKSTNVQSFLFEDYAYSISSNSNQDIKTNLKIFEMKINPHSNIELTPDNPDCTNAVDFLIEEIKH